MSEFQLLIDQLYREEVLRARRLGPQGRLRECIELTEMNLQAAETYGAIEMQRRYRIYTANREKGCYGPPVPRK
jgi:hypothetical protein